MRYIILAFILNLGSTCAQDIVIETQYQFLKGDTWNYLSISVDNHLCSEIQLITNAEAEKGEGCTWNIKPILDDMHRDVFIQPFVIEGSDTILFDKKYLPIRYVDVLISSIQSAISKRDLLQLNMIPGFAYKGHYGCLGVHASSFKVMAMRGDKVLFGYYNTEPQISKKLKDLFLELESGDSLYFFDLKHNLPFYRNIREFQVTLR